MSILLAFLSAFFYGSADTSYRFTLRRVPPLLLAVIYTGTQLAITGVIVGLRPRAALDPAGIAWFALGGVFNPALFMLFFFAGVRRMGSARAATLKATAPIFAVAAAVAILGERPRWPQYGGAVSVAAGVMALYGEGARGDWPWGAAVFPLLAAFSTGFASVLFKLGLGRVPDPYLGLFVALAACAAILVPVWAYKSARRDPIALPAPAAFSSPKEKARTAFLALLSSVVSIGGNLFLFLALDAGRVSTVFPLIQCSPLVVLFYSAVFLRSLERPTGRLFLGVALILAGAYLVTAFRPG
ncbi:MAG: DMT family transporter [Candidatus Tectomicrobia bacterium]|nr:DMT family transporter [Candidatus Tectomicrobia bacterium]